MVDQVSFYVPVVDAVPVGSVSLCDFFDPPGVVGGIFS